VSGRGQPGHLAAAPEASPAVLARIWDPLLRIFHWSLVLLFIIAYVSGSRSAYYQVHVAAGITILGLVAFRLIWGFIGPRPTRFADFLRGVPAVLAHIRDLASGRHRPMAGHNPLGGWAVLAILVLILVEVFSGLFASTFDYDGPLARLVSDNWSGLMAEVHVMNLNLLLAILLIHLAGVAITSALGQENLVASMIHGRKLLPAQVVGGPTAIPRWRGPVAVLAAIALVWVLLMLPAWLG
jgi:cytochrome b